jgi:hypothetical protein
LRHVAHRWAAPARLPLTLLALSGAPASGLLEGRDRHVERLLGGLQASLRNL